jgi:single-strand DNA-binding protein
MNCCIFTGRVGRDAETKYLQDGTPVTNWSMAVEAGWGDNKKTTWLNCALWKRDKMAQYITKGKKILVQGELSEREYTTKDGNQGKSLDLRVTEVDPFWEAKENGGGQNYQQQPKAQPRPAQNTTGAFPSANGSEEEVPF